MPTIFGHLRCSALPRQISGIHFCIHELNDLTYTTRNNLPNLTINVFSYAQQPQDRFVIINMVKYRAGQLIKGGAILKEIRPDSILVQYGNDMVKIDRP